MLSGIKTIRKISVEVVKSVALCHSIQIRVNGYYQGATKPRKTGRFRVHGCLFGTLRSATACTQHMCLGRTTPVPH